MLPSLRTSPVFGRSTPHAWDRTSRSTRFIESLGIRPGSSWQAIVSTAQELFGRPIHVVAADDLRSTAVTGLWVATDEFGIIVVRRDDEGFYRHLSGLHEIAHVLLAYAPRELVQSVLDLEPQELTAGGEFLELCAGADGSPHDEVEVIVEELALAIEQISRAEPLTRTELHL